MRSEASSAVRRIARRVTRLLVHGSRQPARPNKMAAVVVPLRGEGALDDDERFAMRQLRKHLGDHDLFVLLPRGTRNPLPEFTPVRFPRKFFGSAARHGVLLAWRRFYLRFEEYQFILFHHTDSLVFSDQLSMWCAKPIDYIGAPWLSCADSPWVTRERVGNGGLSLLRTEAAVRAIDARHRSRPLSWWLDGFVRHCPRRVVDILRKMPSPAARAAGPLLDEWDAVHDPAPHHRNNDVFWSDLAPYHDPDFRVAPLEEGLAFAFEVNPAGCFARNGRRMPFGCHAWGKYDRRFWEQRLRKEELDGGETGGRIPTPSALPDPPRQCLGWPWISTAPPPPPASPDGTPWPRISVVIPCLNHGQYLEQALRSVILQGYPNLELLVIDGGSTDHTRAVADAYRPWITRFISEKDGGQSAAINRGFSLATGSVFNWLCADDMLCEGSLETVGKAFLDPAVDVFSGACVHLCETDPSSPSTRPPPGNGWTETPYLQGVWQPSTFWRKSALGREDAVCTNLHVCMDRELWCYLVSNNATWRWTDSCLSVYRFTGENKSTTNGMRTVREIAKIHSRYSPEGSVADCWLLGLWLPLAEAARTASSGPARAAMRLASASVSACLLAAFPAREIRALQREYHSYARWE
jgi:hypothetical protein